MVSQKNTVPHPMVFMLERNFWRGYGKYYITALEIKIVRDLNKKYKEAVILLL